MGQFRQAHCPVGAKPGMTLRRTMLLPLLFGFTLSALGTFASIYGLGALSRSALNVSNTSLSVTLAASVALLLVAGADVAFPKIRPTLFHRQTPLAWARRFPKPIAGVLWGLDTGTVVSTFRTSAASWGALALTFAGWGPWWAGIGYAAGFCVPLGVLTATYPVTGHADGQKGLRYVDTNELVLLTGSITRYVRLVVAAIATAALTIAISGSV